MSFRFRKRIKIAPGLHINLSKGWPSLSIGGHGATINVGRRGSRATVGIPGTGMSWQFGGHEHIQKVIQSQADIIAITKRMDTVAKRLTRNAAGSTYWKKAAIEQAGLLDKMLDVAKASENDQLIAAVRKCFDGWADGNPHYRAAVDSGMSITDCLALVLAGKQPDQNVPANLSNHPVTTTNNLKEPAANESPSNPDQLVWKQQPTKEPAFWPAFWKTLGRNLILPAIGCGVIAVVYMIVASKTTSPPPVMGSATPTPEQSAAMPASQTLAATPTPVAPAATPTPQLSTPTPSPTQTTSPSSRKKHPTRNSTRRPER